MVLVQRRSGSSTLSPMQLSSSIAYGDGQISSLSSAQPISSPGARISPESGTHRTFTFDKSSGRSYAMGVFPAYLNKVVLALVALSWIAAVFTNKSALDLWKEFDFQANTHALNLENSLQNLEDAEMARDSFQKQVNLLHNADHVLQHEERMSNELDEAGESKGGFGNPNMFNELMTKRQSILKGKISSLEDYITKESKSEVLRKYGPGPHRVSVSVEFTDTSKVESFVLELASVDVMPHSVYVFLEQVALHLWDGTVFWHQSGIDHVISAAPVDYKSGQNKQHHFQEGTSVAAVSFAEYSSTYPHTKYTIGFAERGPQFYINVQDNTKLHGPGGQKHHELPDEADPCFGKVVSGHKTVEEMYKLQLKQPEQKANEDQTEEQGDWHDNELTHILKIEMM